MRLFNGGISFLLLLFLLSGCDADTSAEEFYLFVGTYTGETSEGIYLYEFNAESGEIDSIGIAAEAVNPSYLALSPNNDYLYAVNEEADSSQATVSAYKFNRDREHLTFLNKQSSEGGAPCYVSVDKKGNTVFIGNYLGGSLSMFPVNEDGSLKQAEAIITHEGSSVNEDRQQSPHVHCTYVSPDNSTVLVADLGTDKVSMYDFNSSQQTLTQNPDFTFEATPGAGPRHLTYHPNKEYAYLVNELNGSVVAFRDTGDSLKTIQTISTLPEDYEGAISGADIHVSPDGKFLYVSNREDLNNIVAYRINEGDGSLQKTGTYASGGTHPRNFTIDPTGNYLLVANRHTDNITVFKRDKESGVLTKTGTEINVSQPVCLKLVPVE